MSSFFSSAVRSIVPAVLVFLMITGIVNGLVAGQSGSAPAQAGLSVQSPPFVAASGGPNAGITVCATTETLGSSSFGSVISVGGNITVCNGGSLTFVNSVVNVISVTQTNLTSLTNDLNYRYHVNVTGGSQLHLVNSTLTTNAGGFHADPKLNLTLAGGSVVSLIGSKLAFAGSIYVSGSSDLFLNSSSIRPNPYPVAPSSPSNFTVDNSFAPSLTVTGSSTVVSTNSTIQKYYKDSAAPGPTLTNNFVSKMLPIPISKYNNVAKIAPPSTNYLVYDTYDQWSSGTATFIINATTNVNGTATFWFNGASTASKPFSAPGGKITTSNLTISPSFLTTSGMNTGGLYGLLTAMGSGAAYLNLTVTSGTGTLTSALVTLMPVFKFNATFSKSSLYAVDSRFDMNWADPACSAAPSNSNKLFLTQGSTASLLNSTTFTTYANTSACNIVNAIKVDTSTSSYWVYDWARVTAVGAGKSPVPQATLSAVSQISNPYYAALATAASNPSNFNALFKSAVVSRAGPIGTAYGVTSNTGTAMYALATGYVNASAPQNGLSVGGLYYLYFGENVTNISGSSSSVVAGYVPTPPICVWPYNSTSCALTVLAPTKLPLFTANLEIQSITLATGGYTCPTLPSCNLFEGDQLYLNVTIKDVNKLLIAGGAQVPVYLNDTFGGKTTGFGPVYITNANIQAGGGTTIAGFTYPLPYHTSGSHSLGAVIDPYSVAPENGTVAKSWTSGYTALPSPRIVSSDITIQLTDSCSGKPITQPSSNSCNQVILGGTVTNSGDAAVNATVSFLWNSTAVGSSQHIAINPSQTITVQTSMLVTYNTSIGTISLTASARGSGVPTFPPINAVNTFSTSFTDFTTLSLSKAPGSFVLWSKGGNGMFYQVSNAAANSTSLSPYGIGTFLGVGANLVNAGGPTGGANVTLFMQAGGPGSKWIPVANLSLGAIAGANAAGPAPVSIPLVQWGINASMIQSQIGPREFDIRVTWSNPYNLGSKQSSFDHFFNVTIRSPTVTLRNLSFTKLSIPVGTVQSAVISGQVSYIGNLSATMFVSLNSSTLICPASLDNGGIVMNNVQPLPSFALPSACLQPGVYDIVVKVTYLNNNTWFHPSALMGAITVTGVKPVPTSFFSQYFLWIIILAIAVAAVLLAIFLFRKMGRGNLVECGECGELIPESAIACPKCGAEFERDLMRCSRCGASIPSTSKVCPECSVLLVGDKEDPMSSDYNGFTQKYRKIAQKELGDNYNEGAFWDWWKRQQSYVPFGSWKQQMHVSATGGASPMRASEAIQAQTMEGQDQYQGQQMQRGGDYSMPPRSQQPQQDVSQAGGMARPEEGMKVCPSCGRTINESFMVCPFCGAVTR